MATLGQELSRLRSLKGWTLRNVEERTKISNSYLYQMESDNVKEPSPNILYKLAGVYGASYADLMRLAGFVVPHATPATSVAFNALDLTNEEKEDVLDFIEFRRRKRKQQQEG